MTLTQGTNTIVGNDPEQVVRETPAVLGGKDKVGQTPELWDGRAAERTVQVVLTGGEVA